jgi:tRNA wybutosine-synthesizing protein 2
VKEYDVKNEIIIDLFSGIGYFTLPIAIYQKPQKIYSCEKNPESYQYLCKNISLNRVNHCVEPLLGDNRKIAPKDISDRVIMGYIGNTKKFLPTAFESLKNQTGIIHFHDTFPDDKVPIEPMSQVKIIAEKHDRKVNMLNCVRVKSYAPGVSHYVLDLKIGEK